MQTDLIQKQQLRYQLLAKLYELTDGSRRNRVDVDQLMEEAAVDRKDFYHILQYLTDEGLAKRINLVAEITHEGIREMEDSLQAPNESTTHFPAQIIQHFHGPVGAFQTGAQATANVTQEVTAAVASEDESVPKPAPISFVDWCTRLLNLLIVESDKDPYLRTEGIDEYALFRLLFEVDSIENFHGSSQRAGTLEALVELRKLDLLEQDTHFWKVTLRGREAAAQMERLWDEICVAKPSPVEERILKAVNHLGESRAVDHASVGWVDHTRLLAEIGESDVMSSLWGVSEDLETRGFVEREALAGPSLELKPTYPGLVWELKQQSLGQPEMGHVLFLDIVGYSKLAMDDQAIVIERLEQLVKSTKAFRDGKQTRNLISLATGDGMALVFFGDVTQNLDCALELQRGLAGRSDLPLRMGLNTGPVYRRVDINTNLNVAGSGINMAQRVMDCGDSGHILLSKRTADVLSELGGWDEQLHDLGEAEVKHGVKTTYTTSITKP